MATKSPVAVVANQNVRHTKDQGPAASFDSSDSGSEADEDQEAREIREAFQTSLGSIMEVVASLPANLGRLMGVSRAFLGAAWVSFGRSWAPFG